MKTLQQQYLLIKEGKGNKDYFLKQARNLFPEYITVNSDYKTAVHVLKSKSILSEGIGGIVTMNPNSKPDWFKIFDTNLKEAVGVKNTKEYGNQNEFDKIDTEVQKTLDNANFDYKDEKNIDNVYGQSFLMGYYTEMKDPKNADKTVDELKNIVLKNMVKDVTYYNTKASFGVKDIGYTKDVVGGGDPVAPKGKYKSSGYGDMPKAKVVKEGKDKTISSKVENLADKVVKWYEKHPNPKMKERINSVEKTLENLMSKTIGKDAISYSDFEKQIKNKFNLPFEDPQYLKFKKSSLNEAKKRPGIAAEIKEIEKSNEALALESKIEKIKEAITMRENKLKIAESEEVAEMIDEKMVKELQKEIKELEKYKTKAESLYEKLTKTKSKEVIKDEEITENQDFDFEKSAIESASGDKVEQREFDDYDRPLYYSLSDDNVHYFIGDGNNGKVIVKYNAETGERYPIGDLEHYN
jgi:hypothetical protein